MQVNVFLRQFYTTLKCNFEPTHRFSLLLERYNVHVLSPGQMVHGLSMIVDNSLVVPQKSHFADVQG